VPAPLDTFAVGLTAEQITTSCETLAGNPKLNLHPTTHAAPDTALRVSETPAYIWLNTILRELYQTYEWPFLDGAAEVTIAGVENPLPPDFLRVRFQDPLFLLLTNGDRTRVKHLSPEAFFSRALAVNPGQPSIFTTQRLSPALPALPTATGGRSSFFVDPPPDMNYPGELHYRRGVPLITDRTQVPLFPSKELLELKLLLRYYTHQNDSRAAGLADPNAGPIALKMRELRTEVYDQGEAENTIPMSSAYFPRTCYEDD